MSDPETTAIPTPDQIQTPSPPPPMETQPQQLHQDHDKPGKFSDFTFSIWPPKQRTRDAIINRLIETLSTPSVLSKRYGTMPHEEASSAARLIEEEAFSAASGAASTENDGIETLQAYSKDISKRMLEAVKARASSASASTTDSSGPQIPTTIDSENISIES